MSRLGHIWHMVWTRAYLALRSSVLCLMADERPGRLSSAASRAVSPSIFGRWQLPPRGVDPWSKNGIETQLERLNGVGLLSPRFVPYRPVGMPDLVRDRSLLPKQYRVFKGGYQEIKKPSLFDVLEDGGDHVILPLRIKGCQWNGERWCATNFSPNVARCSNGSALLQNELLKSEQRLRRSRVGDYFLRETCTPPDKGKPGRKPSVPALPISQIPKFEVSEEAAKNRALMHEYRMEARRVASDRSTKADSQKPTTEQTFTGMPPKALEEYSLQQLSSILGKETSFSALQQKYNRQLYRFCDSSETLRPYTFRRKYGALKAVHSNEISDDPNPASSMDQAEVFLKGLEQHPWYRGLAQMIFAGDRSPRRGEWLILNKLRLVVEGGGTFGVKEFVDLLYSLAKEGADLNEAGTAKALGFIRQAVKVPDLALEGFVKSCQVVPQWLSNLYHPRYGRLISFRRPTA